MNLSGVTAEKLVSLYKNKELTVTEVIRGLYETIEQTDRDVRAFITLCRDAAMEQASAVDAKIAAGEPTGSLAGVPVAIKDNMAMQGVATTCGSRILEGYKPPYTATAVERLRQADAVIIGKTNLDEFAMGCPPRIPATF
jgi:aspartyl-tRNA(Asn)/glutamyl-tRNA(Gln) amidotransferase subunit A